ncbi:MAG: phosphate signaling complex protein PhoU [Deltaproteobacteria bacterium]|nr:phosphate signaling complex protein PhoU [Deltaproteobacteria bacterium]
MADHTSRAYETELRNLKDRLLAMGGRCEQLIMMATRALGELDADLAKKVEQTDRAINVEEVAIDEATVRILALRQPVGRDLRFLVLALKVVTDLERIGDEAVNMAERAVELAKAPPILPLQPQLQELADASAQMVRQALDSFVTEDEKLARAVLAADDHVDALYGKLLRASMAMVEQNPSRVQDGFRFAFCAKYLERVADHATNIAEQVVFMVSGDDVRHLGSRDGSPKR